MMKTIFIKTNSGYYPANIHTLSKFLTKAKTELINKGRIDLWKANIIDETTLENDKQVLFLFKPEVLNKSSDSNKIINYAFENLNCHGYKIQAISLLSGKFIRNNGIYERHYYHLNKGYNEGFYFLTDKAKENFHKEFKIEANPTDVLSGPDFMNLFNFSLSELEEISQTSFKFGKVKQLSFNTYVHPYHSDYLTKWIVNGLNISFFKNYCSDDSVTAAILIKGDESASNLSVLHKYFLGHKNPLWAESGSLRNWIFINKESLNLESVNIFNNGFHLTSSPLASIFEISNWFPWIKPEETVMGKIIEKNLPQKGIVNKLKSIYYGPDDQKYEIFDVTKYNEPISAVEKLKDF